MRYVLQRGRDRGPEAAQSAYESAMCRLDIEHENFLDAALPMARKRTQARRIGSSYQAAVIRNYEFGNFCLGFRTGPAGIGVHGENKINDNDYTPRKFGQIQRRGQSREKST